MVVVIGLMVDRNDGESMGQFYMAQWTIGVFEKQSSLSYVAAFLVWREIMIYYPRLCEADDLARLTDGKELLSSGGELMTV